MDTNQEDPSDPDPNPNPNSQCRLFTLPTELRHQIYEHVFTITYPDPYIARHCNSILHLNTSSSPPRLNQTFGPRPSDGFNQLKYVCGFLYHETSLLEVKHNTLKFTVSEEDRVGPAERFSEFIKRCSAKKASLIRNVILDNDAMSWKTPTIEEPRHFLAIAEFCRRNPHVNVEYIPNQMSWNWYSPQNVVELGVLINLLVRGKDLRKVVGTSSSAFHFKGKWLAAWLDERDVAQQLDVPNLRFWPLTGSEGFDEEGFRERSGEVGADMGNLDLDKCLELVREWRVSGI